MRRLCVLWLGLAVVVVLAGSVGASTPVAVGTNVAGACQVDTCGPCGDYLGPKCSACGHCGAVCCCARHVAEVGYFNCRCRGSYKFPVPPRFTYHWPGMYSQQTMTEHLSRWQNPPFLPAEGYDIHSMAQRPRPLAIHPADTPRSVRSSPQPTVRR
ncbi:MAG: hypothetical protein JW818_10040 [Pirellulales bacterium]|nr:hypothetical protein [Pirellulales bacterium]